MISNKKRSRRWLFIIIFPVLCFFLWFIFSSIKSDKEDHHRTVVMVTLKGKIEEYHKQYNKYPQTLLKMDLQNKEIIAEYIQSGVYIYSRDPSGKKWYRLICRFSGLMKIGNGKHSVSWSGLQYSNSKEQLDLMPGEYSQPDKNGFYFVDLH